MTQANVKNKINKNIKKWQHHIFALNDQTNLDVSLKMIQKNKDLSLSVTLAGNYILKQNQKGVTV